MNTRAILKYIGFILIVEGIFMIPAAVLAIVYHEMAALRGFLYAMLVIFALGAVLALQKRGHDTLDARDGFVTVALGWILIALFGMLPYYFSGAIPNLLDCWFESVSGFTTTGATILEHVEELPHSILFWRSFSLWLGGMGVLVFMLAIVPQAKGSGGEAVHLLRAEVPGPSVGKFTPRLKNTVRIMYFIYIGLTLVEAVFLMAGGMPVFDSFVTAFSVAGTGGFSIKNAGFAHYDSTYIEMVVAVFMALFGINFTLYYFLLIRQFRAIAKNEELRVYGLIVLVATLIIALDLMRADNSTFSKALLDGFFHTSSTITTTGYYRRDYNLWPQLSRYVTMLLMIIGSCAGSTGGGMKVGRVLILMKGLGAQLKTMLRPRAVNPVRMDGKTLPDETVRGAYAYVAAYLCICVASIFLITLDGHTMETNVTAVIASMSNIGPGLGEIGPTANFGFFSPVSKLVLSLDMLLGRLEIFPILLLAAPATWRRKA